MYFICILYDKKGGHKESIFFWMRKAGTRRYILYDEVGLPTEFIFSMMKKAGPRSLYFVG